jgi:abequosyltransferase
MIDTNIIKTELPKLSICIPCYNFGAFIGETLDNILPQISEAVEVIVLDGGSTDNTAAVVASRQLDFPMLFYHQQGFRGGIDRDIETVISFARGEYCWLISADDILLPGSLEKVLNALNTNYDVYLTEHVLCNLDMQPISPHPPFTRIRTPRLFDLSDAAQRMAYFEEARTSEVFFSFLSSPVFKKTLWDSAKIPDSFRETCWIVAGHLLSCIPKGFTVYYMAQTLLHKRGENDSFADKGRVNRYRIAIETFQYVGNSIFGADSKEAFHIRRVLQVDIPLHYLLLAKLNAAQYPEKEDITVLDRVVALHYLNPGFSTKLKQTVYHLAPVSLLGFLYAIKKAVLKTKNQKPKTLS